MPIRSSGTLQLAWMGVLATTLAAGCTATRPARGDGTDCSAALARAHAALAAPPDPVTGMAAAHAAHAAAMHDYHTCLARSTRS